MTNQERIQSNNAELQECIARANALPNAGGSIDVTAEGGQTIGVEEVDAAGKPTKWRAADYQPRTHWSEDTVVLPESTVEADSETGVAFFPYVTLEVGKEYVVKYNGVEYIVTTIGGGEGIVAMGNCSVLGEGIPATDEPFAIMTISGDGEEPITGCIPLDGSTSVTLSISEEKYHTIPREYVPKPYYVYDIAMDQFNYNTDQHRAILTEIPIALLEAMHLRMPIYMRVTDTSNQKEYMASATWGGMGIDYLWSIVDKASETIPVDGSMTIMDIRLSAHLSESLNSFNEYFVRFATTFDDEQPTV
jgi:hypothetical protein